MSRFIISFVLFLLVNIVAAKALTVFASPKHLSSTEHSWTEWALIDFEKHKDTPAPIVFLGSSLMLMPMNRTDAHFLNSTIDGAVHHKSDFFSQLINQERKSSLSNFNFALPGLMPSDAYLITTQLLSNSNHPQLIIYGLGPRDFLDNLLMSPASTDPYHCLSDRLNGQTVLAFTGHDWQSKFNYFFGEYLPLYKQRNKIISVMAPLSSIHADTPPITVQQLHAFLPNYNPMHIGLNECLFNPNEPVDPDRFAKNLDEYRQRYGQINWDTFTCQSKFFLDVLKQASQSNIKILVAAMPITSVNRQLLPDYVYTAYKENLRILSKSYSASFIDLDNSGCFTDEDFMDTVHLNASGGSKLLTMLAKHIIKSKLIDLNKNDRPRLADTGIKI